MPDLGDFLAAIVIVVGGTLAIGWASFLAG